MTFSFRLVSNTGNTGIVRTVETKSLSLIINRDKNHKISYIQRYYLNEKSLQTMQRYSIPLITNFYMSSIDTLVHSLVLDYKYDNIEYNTTQNNERTMKIWIVLHITRK